MDLIPVVSEAVAAFAGVLAIGLVVLFVAVALARLSVDFFK